MKITTRSRNQAFLDCARKGYLGYEAPNDTDGGVKGWERRALNIFLATGIYTHQVIELRLKGASMKEAIQQAITEYFAEASSRGLECEVADDSNYAIFEQAAMIEAFGWGFERVWIPRMEAEWEWTPEMVEMELTTPLSDDLMLASRIDLVARRKLDGRLFEWNFKTVGQAGDKWYQGFEHDAQIMTETLAYERNFGEKVAGVNILGFVKGNRVGVDAEGHEVRGDEQKSMRPIVRYIQRSPLIYGWKFDGNPPLEPASYDYVSSRKKGWHRFPVWQEDAFREVCAENVTIAGEKNVSIREMSPIEWWVKWLPLEVVEQNFASVPPVMRDDESVQNHVVQIIGMEERIASGVVDEIGVDHAFPMNHRNCIWPVRCQFYDACYTAGVGDDPVGSGLYQPRTANHPIEGE